MSKLVKSSNWVVGSLSILSGVFNLVDRYMTLEYQDRQSRRMHDEAVLEISERASIIRAKIEADAKNFNNSLALTENQLEADNHNFTQIQTLLIDSIRETSDTDKKVDLIDRLAIVQKSFYDHKSALMSEIIGKLPNFQLPGNVERKQVTDNA